MRKARQALSSSRTLLEAGDTNGACNRAYYAMFYSAHAALEIADAIAPGVVMKTHGGLISVFSQKLILSAKIDARHGRALSQVYDARLVADYQGDPIKAGDAIWAIEGHKPLSMQCTRHFSYSPSARRSYQKGALTGS